MWKKLDNSTFFDKGELVSNLCVKIKEIHNFLQEFYTKNCG